MMMNKMSTFILTFVGPLGSNSGVYCCQQVERRAILEGVIGDSSEWHSTSLQHYQQGGCLHTGDVLDASELLLVVQFHRFFENG